MSLTPDDNDGKLKNLTGDNIAPKPNPANAFRGGNVEGKGRSKKITAQGGVGRGWIIFTVVMIVFGACGPLFFFVLAPSLGWFNVFGEDTRAVPGSESAFDPIAVFGEIEAYASGENAEALLVSLEARYVRSDGTLDLNASYKPRVTWKFILPVPPPADAPPIGAGGAVDARYFQNITVEAYTPGQMRHVETISGGVSTSYTYRHLGLERVEGSVTSRREQTNPAPQCHFSELWEYALTQEVPADAVAIITYDRNGYEFRIGDIGVRILFDMDCKPKNS